jgi:probable HAF family extracellular repeat protein
MRTITAALVLVPLLLLPAGCTDELTEPDTPSFKHAPGHGKGGDDGEAAFRIMTLGTLGGSRSQAHAINNGAVVVGEATSSAGQIRGFVWTESEGMRDLLGIDYEPFNYARHLNHAGKAAGLSQSRGFVQDLATRQVTWLAGLPDHETSQAIAINVDGIVVGRGMAVLESGALQWRTVAWVPAADGGYGDPIDLDCPTMQLYAAVNAHGDVVANQCRGDYSPPRMWRRSGDGWEDPVVLGTLGGRGRHYATGIDDRGRIAGSSVAPNGARRAVFWHPANYAAPIDLGDASAVLAMNNQNGIVGERISKTRRVAALWTVDDAGNLAAVLELPSLPGYPDSWANGINDDGWIVGALHGNKSSAAVLWRP